MELSDQILKALMDVDQERGHFFSLKSITDKHRPPLSPAKIAKIIDRLEENGHIQTSTHKTKGVPHFIKVNAAAYKYFKAKDARKSVIESRRTGYAERFQPQIEEAIKNIRSELKDRLAYFKKKGLYLEAERLEQRTFVRLMRDYRGTRITATSKSGRRIN